METGKLEEIRYLPSLLFPSIAAIVNCPFPFASRPRRETLHGGDVAQWQPLLTTGEPSTRDLKVNWSRSSGHFFFFFLSFLSLWVSCIHHVIAWTRDRICSRHAPAIKFHLILFLSSLKKKTKNAFFGS
jgi:hypothetical protein